MIEVTGLDEVRREALYGKYKIHPLAELFPELSPEEYRKLRDDIKAHGQLDPIVATILDVILDGRHRLRACKELGVEPLIIHFPVETLGSGGTEADFIWSRNVLRRHLTDDQRAAIAVKFADAEKAAAKQRQRVHGRTAPGKSKNTFGENTKSVPHTREALAEKAQTSPNKIRDAQEVERRAPELLAKVARGETKLRDVVKSRTIHVQVQPHKPQEMTVGVSLVPDEENSLIQHPSLTGNRAWLAMKHAIATRRLEEFADSAPEIIAKNIIENDPDCAVDFIALLVKFFRPGSLWTL